MKDLVQRLRSACDCEGKTLYEAADAIEKLEAENAALQIRLNVTLDNYGNTTRERDAMRTENAQLKESRDKYSETVERLSVHRKEMLKDRIALAIENKRIKDDLNWVERCANHHDQKASITPAQTLSFIQHYPPIKAITKAYSDGKMPTTLDPYAEIAALKAELAAQWIPITERLPEPEVSVLCYGPNTIQPDLPWIMFVDWRGSKPDFERGVTHWRPLPAGPKANHE